MAIVGEMPCEAVDLRAGSTVLDVACGSGNATPAAARRFRVVLSTFGVMFAPDQPRVAGGG